MKYIKVEIDNLLPCQRFLSKDRLVNFSTIEKEKMNFIIDVIELNEKNKYYITNGHHRARFLYEKGEKEIVVRIKKNQSKKRMKNMWNFLKTHNYTHIKDLELINEDQLKKYFDEVRSKK